MKLVEGFLASTMNKVSIVMPTFNRAYCLRRTIQSVLDQTHANWELLVVDNTSTDNTERLVEQFGDERIRFFQVLNNGIIAFSRNIGIAAASGRFIAFMDSDDPWLPRKLELSLAMLSSGFDIVYHDLYVTDGEDRSKKTKTGVSRYLNSPVLHDLVKNGNGINTSSVVAKADMVKAVGGFTESRESIGIEDYDLWVRIAMQTDRFGFIKEPLGYYTVDGNGTLNKDLIEKNLLYIAEHYKDLHQNICEGTPGWLDLAIARFRMEKNPAESLSRGLRALQREGKVWIKIKAIAVVCVGSLRVVKERVNKKFMKLDA